MTSKFSVVARVFAVLPWLPEDFCSPTGIYRIQLTLKDPIARIHAFLSADDAVKLFGGLDERNCQMVDSSYGGTFLHKTADEVKDKSHSNKKETKRSKRKKAAKNLEKGSCTSALKGEKRQKKRGTSCVAKLLARGRNTRATTSRRNRTQAAEETRRCFGEKQT
ncbi:hypothetical protein M9H77_31892 [Catharanthus roseus]|uniref:Uncharacterized protein n=1 Tax=Catharanthus roseus TaxID=4058 RepID=A0ACC0A2E2_CATRO|nr:hypothetical protein M9H77_31892 [Catharanthus roseus]